MVFTQGPLSIGEPLEHERRNPSITFFSDGDGGTPSLFVQAANLWYDVRDTYIVRFVADGCRKNLPLSVTRRVPTQSQDTLGSDLDATARNANSEQTVSLLSLIHI